MIVTLAISAFGFGPAVAQTTTCNKFGTMVTCNTIPAPDYSGMQRGMAEFGAAMGRAAAAARERKASKKIAEERAACMGEATPLSVAIRDYGVCIRSASLGLEASGGDAGTIADAALYQCSMQRSTYQAQMLRCHMGDDIAALDKAARDMSINTTLTTRAARAKPTS